MLYTQKAVQENLRNRDGKRVFFLGKGDQLTSDARSFLTREGIEILPAGEAKPARWKLPGGGFTEEKREDMTHLNGDTLVKKTHPRIKFRGVVDMLEAEILWCMQTVPDCRGELQEILDLTRNVIRWDVLDEPAKQAPLCGLTADEIRIRSHRPQDYYGIAHFMPAATDGSEILALNRVRCWVRMAELAACDAFADRENNCLRPDLVRVLNRMSSMVYLLMIRKKGEGK